MEGDVLIKIENVEVVGWEHAIMGMRNPLNSWNKSDSFFCDANKDCRNCPIANDDEKCNNADFVLGDNDLDLAKRLVKAGTDHRKFMRMITVYLDITAPLYWWKEYDTYKVGTVANSCSTMHKIHEKEFTREDFSFDKIDDDTERKVNMATLNEGGIIEDMIFALNEARSEYLRTNDKKWWWYMIQLLPSSYNQRRTVVLNYEVLANMYHSRKNHKLDEWRAFCEWIESLPYSELITGGADNE